MENTTHTTLCHAIRLRRFVCLEHQEPRATIGTLPTSDLIPGLESHFP